MSRRAVILLVFVIVVCLSFWLISRYPALGGKAAMSGMEAFDDPLTHNAHFTLPPGSPTYKRILYSTLNWYETNWRGMFFGLVLAGGFLALLNHLPKRPSSKPFVNSFFGMLTGTPLGVCVNCVAPIAKGIYEAGSKMETALAVMFSSPTLNVVVLTMLFSIFPFYMAIAKLASTFFLILVVIPLISKNKTITGISEKNQLENTICELLPEDESWLEALKGTIHDYWKSFSYIFIKTAPLMLLAGFLGATFSQLSDFDRLIGLDPNWRNLAALSLMGTFLPLPIAFDLMLAQAMMISGLSPGLVMVMLFTLGTFSVYSAMIVYQTFSFRLAAGLFLIVAAIGAANGLLVHQYSEHKFLSWLESYNKIVVAEEPKITNKNTFTAPTPQEFLISQTESRSFNPIWENNQVLISSISHTPKSQDGSKPFSTILGPTLGIGYSNKLTPNTFFDPLFYGRGIASGDFDKDGWIDLVTATNNGFELYQNLNGKRFQKIPLPINNLSGKQSITVAMADFDNDGWLDIFFTTLGDGNHIWLNPLSSGKTSPLIPVPNGNAFLTSATAFSDLNNDKFLDIVNGNYFLGTLTKEPVDAAVDQLIINNNLKFDQVPLKGIPGQTHSVLFADFDNNGKTDLAIGNDYRVADAYYLGKGNGNFEKIKNSQGIIPKTPQNTMSIDSGDFDNNLIPDLYMANIGLSKGTAVVANVFGKKMKEAGETFCLSGKSVLTTKECQKQNRMTTLLNPEKKDSSERCLKLDSKSEIRQCMAMRLALMAIKRKDKSLCAKIVEDLPLIQNLCEKYFQSKFVKAKFDEEIPMKTHMNILLQGEKSGVFTDISDTTNIAPGEWSWNAKFADLDNDEWQDLYIVNGVPITQDFTPNVFFHNQKGKTFSSAAKKFGLDDFDHSSSYTYIDIDRDGDLDIIANTLYGPFKVYWNNLINQNGISFKLRDDIANRFCIGCKITIYYGDEKKQFREIKAGGGFHSFDAPEAYFGLASHKQIARLDIRWSNGEINQINQPLTANYEYQITRKNK